MSDGFMTWYLRGPIPAHFVNWPAGTRAALTYPGSHGEVSVLDLEGDRGLVTQDTFMSLLQGGEPTLTFQMWYSSSEDMVVTVRRRIGDDAPSGEFYCVIFELDGLTTDQMDAAVLGSVPLTDEAPQNIVGIVVDRAGVTADFDWDAFMSENAT